MIEKIIIAGFGGQGVLLLGKVLAEAAMREGKYVTWLPAYGAEVRGGTAYCMVTISSDEIASPYIDQADVLMTMNRPSWEKFKARLRLSGTALINSDTLAAKDKIKAKRAFQENYTHIASVLGDIRVANIVMLGSYIALGNIVKSETVLSVMRDFVPKGKDELLAVNKIALQKGMALVHSAEDKKCV